MHNKREIARKNSSDYPLSHFLIIYMDDLHGFNEWKLYEKMFLPDGAFQEWLKDAGLLYRQRYCAKLHDGIQCKHAMTLKWREGESYPTWKCAKRHSGKKCDAECGFLQGTFFEGTHLPLKDVFRLSFYFVRQTHTNELIQIDLKRSDGTTIGRKALTEWNKNFREVCHWYFALHPVKIGGDGVIVEIDETVLSKRKYNRGRLIVNQQWFFGGVERGNGRCFLVPVERRDAQTLLPLIQKFIHPGSIILSDCWAAYNHIDKLPELYRHYTVNHSQHFIDPVTGTHTQSIEGTWGHFKNRHKEEHGTARHLFAQYIDLFMWHRVFTDPEEIMYNFWTQVRDHYPMEQEEKEAEQDS